MHAITQLLSVAVRLRDPTAVRARIVSEAREFFDVTCAVLLTIPHDGGGVETVALSPDTGRRPAPVALTELPALRELLDRGLPALTLEGEAAAEIGIALGSTARATTVMLLPMHPAGAVQHVLLLADGTSRRFSAEDVEVGGAFAAAVSASLAHLRLDEENAAQIAKQAALARAAKTLNESLDLNHVLMRICQEAASILDGDNAVVYRGNGTKGLTVEATYGLSPAAIGHRVSPGGGLAGEVAALDRPLVTNDHPSPLSGADRGLFGDVRSCVAVPIRWDGELRGVLAVGYERDQVVTGEQQGLLEALGELAGAACRNASRHSGLAREARTDGLTGCINHSAMHDTLRREIQRCERAGGRLSLVLVDLDDFKQVNEEHGHLAGDEVLRRVGHALRQSVRPYDIVARYGGDEFAIVAAGTDEGAATEMARRALAGVSAALEELGDARPGCGASAGVAEWAPGETSTCLIHRADRSLLYAKQHGLTGTVVTDSQLPADFGPARIGRRESPSARSSRSASVDTGGEQIERLRTRTRQLARANQLGRRVTAMTDPQAIMDAAVDQLHRSFGYPRCAVVRVRESEYVIESAAGRGPALVPPGEHRGSEPAETAAIDRCLRERRPVIVADVHDQRGARSKPATQGARSELVVPLWVGGELWGAIDIMEARTHAFASDDACLVQAVADQVGAALYSAMLYERLDRAYVGTAEVLATALEAKDSHNVSRSRTVVDRTTAVGRRLGLAEDELRTLRFGAILHDIGKVAVPERILNKRGPLTEAERRKVERHPVVGERILSSVDFLRDVLPLVRHEHERWDGKGYPDGLADERIPIGSRIILACDAYDAMTSDRPYRPAMSDAEARAELRAGAGTQFDERVVAALLE
jgi:diguanylate cyclase (GGDEF)-like protein